MIRLSIKDQETIYSWYANEVIQLLSNRRKKRTGTSAKSDSEANTTAYANTTAGTSAESTPETTPAPCFLTLAATFLHQLEGLMECDSENGDTRLRALLTVPFWKMKETDKESYEFFSPYWKFVLWYVSLAEGEGLENEGDNPWKDAFLTQANIREVRSDENTRYYQGGDSADLAGPELTTAELCDKVESELKRINKRMEASISYSYLTVNIKRALAAKLNIRVCPYCNQGFVYSLAEADVDNVDKIDQYLGDLDHLYPKKIFPLFSMSIWNLVPSCKVCNQLFKGKHTTDLLNPLEEGFGDSCRLQLDWSQENPSLDVNQLIGDSDSSDSRVQWCVDPLTEGKRKERIENNIQTFHLNELYNVHKGIIRDTLHKKVLYQGAYLDELKKVLGNIAEQNAVQLSHEDMNHLLYGVSMDPAQDQNEIHGKMIRDLIETNAFYYK